MTPAEAYRLTQRLLRAGSVREGRPAATVVYLSPERGVVRDSRGRILAHVGLGDIRRRSTWNGVAAVLGHGTGRMLRVWAALLAAATCADLAKLGFVLVWAEATGRLTWPEWLVDDVRVAGLIVSSIAGAVGAIWFVRLAWTVRKLRTAGDEDHPFGNDPPPDDRPPRPRRCGVPRPPRNPGPLAAHAGPSQRSSLRQQAVASL